MVIGRRAWSHALIFRPAQLGYGRVPLRQQLVYRFYTLLLFLIANVLMYQRVPLSEIDRVTSLFIFPLSQFSQLVSVPFIRHFQALISQENWHIQEAQPKLERAKYRSPCSGTFWPVRPFLRPVVSFFDADRTMLPRIQSRAILIVTFTLSNSRGSNRARYGQCGPGRGDAVFFGNSGYRE